MSHLNVDLGADERIKFGLPQGVVSGLQQQMLGNGGPDIAGHDETQAVTQAIGGPWAPKSRETEWFLTVFFFFFASRPGVEKIDLSILTPVWDSTCFPPLNSQRGSKKDTAVCPKMACRTLSSLGSFLMKITHLTWFRRSPCICVFELHHGIGFMAYVIRWFSEPWDPTWGKDLLVANLNLWVPWLQRRH